jgi:hypothetical protein
MIRRTFSVSNSTVRATLAALVLGLAAVPASAGVPLVTPPEGARIIDFDNVENAPASFNQTDAVREHYEALGVDFTGAVNNGGAVLAENGSFGISGFSAPNVLAFNVAATLQGGGKPIFPQGLQFQHPVRYVQFNVGDTSGLTITAEAFDVENNSLDVENVVPGNAMQTVVLEARHIAKVVITGGGLTQIIDDVAFVLDTTVIDFDEEQAPTSFMDAVPLRREYIGDGFRSYSSTFSNTTDGAAVLDASSGIAVTGYSAPNFLALDGQAFMSNGGTPKLPVYLEFFPPVKYVRFLVGDPDGATVTVKASYFGGPPVHQVEVEAEAAMKPVEITGDQLTFIEITSTDTDLVIDDLEFLVDGTKIDFDDYTNAPNLFGEATAIRNRYEALGVRFTGPGNAGPTLLGFNTFGVTGLSGSNFLAFDAGEQLANGAEANLPVTIEFDRPMKRVDFFAGSNQSTRIFYEATDAAGEITSTGDIITKPEMDVVFIYFEGTTKIELTAQGNQGVIDNLTFAPTDECAFDLCYQGETLNRHCSACATIICAENSNCCNDAWDESCAVLAEASCNLTCGPLCGDANADRKVSAPDALGALRTAVGASDCEAFRCDYNGAGGVTSTDALFILRKSVGQPTVPNCPPPPL